MNIFSIPFYKFSIEDWEDVKPHIINEYLKADLKCINSNLLSDNQLYTDYYDIFQHKFMPEYLSNTLKILSPQIEKFFEQVSEFCDKSLIEKSRVTSAWYERLEKNMNHPIHNHGAIGFSAVCYINFDKNIHLPTIFLAPFNSFLNGQTLHYQPDVDEGDIVFFPSFLQHYAPTNTTDNNRLIFSFNIR
jgi:hypothetical protein